MITHNQAISMLDDFMEGQGWMGVKRRAGRIQLAEHFNHNPDRIFYWPGMFSKLPLFMEVKPENVDIDELEKGIGQAVFYLKYQAKSYLVIPEEKYINIKLSILQTSLGIILYKFGEIYLERSGPERDLASLPPVPPFTIPPTVVRPLLIAILTENCPRDDWYSLDWIVNRLKEAYPLMEINRATVGRLLHLLGFHQKYFQTSPGKAPTLVHKCEGKGVSLSPGKAPTKESRFNINMYT